MNSSNKLEAISNIATTTVAILLSVVLVKQFLLPGQRSGGPRSPKAIARGADLSKSLPRVDWAKNGRTLIIAISTQCHFCKDSVPFYQRLNREASRTVKLLAVLPQTREDAAKFLQDEGVQVDDIRQAQANSIGVQATPTLILVDNAGKVIDSWVGKLQPDQQDKVLAEINNNAVAQR